MSGIGCDRKDEEDWHMCSWALIPPNGALRDEEKEAFDEEEEGGVFF